jgi:transposase
VATTPDGVMTSLIHHKLAEKDGLPKEHYVDAAYVDAYQLVESHQAHQVELVDPVAVDVSWQSKLNTGFDVSAFLIDWDKKIAQCPQGNLSRSWRIEYDKSKHPVIQVVFDRQHCTICPERSRCTKSLKAPRKLKLRPRDEYESLNLRRQDQKTKEFKKKYSCRAGIEGTISQGVRKLDLRRTRYSGLAKTHLQHIAIACAMNLSRFFAQSNGLLKAATRTSSFARLRTQSA